MEQPGGRVYPLKSLGYENQQTRDAQSNASFPPSGALMFVALRCGSVRFYWRFHRAVRLGSARFTYIGVSTAKSQPK